MRHLRLLVLGISAATLALALYSPATVPATMLVILILGAVVDGLLSSRARVSDGMLSLPEVAATPEPPQPPQDPPTTAVPLPWRLGPGWSLSIAILSYVPLSLSFGGVTLLGRSLAGLLPWSIAMFALDHWQRPFMRALRVNSGAFVILASAMAFAVGLVTQWLLLGSAYSVDNTALGMGWFWLSLLLMLVIGVVMTHVLDLLRRDDDVLAEQVRERQELRALLEARAEPLRRQVAQILHGPIQGRLAAVVLTLRLQAEAQQESQESAWRETMARCRTLLELLNRDLESLRSGDVGPRIGIGAHLDLLRQRWGGLLTMQGEVSAEAIAALQEDPVTERRVCGVVEEAIHNACTHGQARAVSVRIDMVQSDSVKIEVTDDGSGPPSHIRAGHGLDGITGIGGTWRMEARHGGGASLIAVLPRRHSEEDSDRAEAALHL